MRKIFLLLSPLPLWAGLTGKLAGYIKDKTTGSPLPFVHVYVEDEKKAVFSDKDGFYAVLNLSPGKHKVIFTLTGYKKKIIEDVEIKSDQTTFLDIHLEPTEYLLEEVVVKAEPPLVEKGVTFKKSILKKEKTENLPVMDFSDLIYLEGGFTKGPHREIHLRGGREKELAVYVDGLPLLDPLTRENALYINPYVYEEMSLYAGTFSAEYGNALSGAINIITEEGGEKPEFFFSYLTPPLYYYFPLKFSIFSPYRRKDAFKDILNDTTVKDAHRDSLTGESLYDPPSLKGFNGDLRLQVKGPLIFKSLPFSVYYTKTREMSYLPFGYDDLIDYGTKLGLNFIKNTKVSLTYQKGEENYKRYSHRWKYIPEHYPSTLKKWERGGISFQGLLFSKLSFTISLGFLKINRLTSVGGKKPWEYEEPVSDGYAEFYVSGDAQVYENSKSESYLFKGDFQYQLSRHEFKTGFEGRLHNFNVEKLERYYMFGYVGEGSFFKYRVKPRDYAFYIQDKVEYPGIVLNLGLRLDAFEPKAYMWKDPENPGSEIVKVPPRYQFSPRLGFAYPILEQTVLHFSYGHFFQAPPYEVMYHNYKLIFEPESMPKNYAVIGNPSLKPEKTIAYELGLSHALWNTHSFSVSLYAKDIWNLLSTKRVVSFPYDYAVYQNADFASVRGMELGIEKKRGSGIFYKISYVFQIARANRSFPLQAFYNAYTGMPEEMKEYDADFDRRHSLKVSFNIPFHKGNGNLGLFYYFESGLPYTPFLGPGVVAEPNSARMPPNQSLDLRLDYGFKVKNVSYSLVLQVENLFNFMNPVSVYPATGDPLEAGEYGSKHRSEDLEKDPSHLGPPRSIRFGIKVEL